MRRANLQFTKGSIVFAQFDNTDSRAVLNGRPLIIVSTPIHVIGLVLVAETTTQPRPGIKCHLWNYYEKKPLGGYDYSVIKPYAIHSIQTHQIRNVIGTLDPWLMKSVDESVKFFLGYTDTIPQYLTPMEEELFGIEYSYNNDSCTINEKVDNNIDGSYLIVHDAIETSSEDANHFSLSSKSNNSTIECTSYDIKKKLSDFITEWVSGELEDVRSIPTAKLTPTYLFENLSETALNLIASRALTVSEIDIIYKIDMYKAAVIRTNVTKAILSIGQVGVRMIDSEVDVSTFPECLKLGMLLYNQFCNSDISLENQTKINSIVNPIKNKYNIDFENKRTWKAALSSNDVLPHEEVQKLINTQRIAM